MKKCFAFTMYAVLFSAMVATQGCKKDQTDTYSYTVPANESCLGYEFYLGSQTFTYDINTADVQQAFADQGLSYDVSKVTTAKLTGLKATTDGSNTFNDVLMIEVFIKVAGASGNGTLLAHAENITSGTKTIALTLTDTEIKGYLNGNSEIQVKYQNKNTGMVGVFPCVTLSQGVIQAQVEK